MKVNNCVPLQISVCSEYRHTGLHPPTNLTSDDVFSPGGSAVYAGLHFSIVGKTVGDSGIPRVCLALPGINSCAEIRCIISTTARLAVKP